MKRVLKLVMIAAAMSLLFVSTISNNKSAEADTVYDYVQDFSDSQSVEQQFNAYFLDNALGSAKAEWIETDTSAEGHWLLENGQIKRRFDVNSSFDTNKIAVLTFSSDSFVNFELSVDYKQGTDTYFWPVIGFRQNEEGKYTLADGAGIFVQQGGQVTLWGTTPVGGPHEIKTVSGYDRTIMHNLRLVVQGNRMEVYVDGGEAVVRDLPSDFYQYGYVSLISVNNSTVYDNFKIRKLSEPQPQEKFEFPPKPDAGTSDSLDTLAGSIKDESLLMERIKIEQPPETRSCGSSGSASLIIAIGLFLMFKRIKY